MISNDAFAFRSWIFELKQKNLALEDLPQEYSISTAQAQVGWIVPFTLNDLNDQFKIDLLVSWRNAHRESFVSNDTVNFESTTNWLSTQVLENTCRELFWIANIEKVLIGHIGIFYDDMNQRFELDSVLRGVESERGIMWQALAILERLVHQKFFASHLHLRVLKTNQKAINFYRRNGYKEQLNLEDSLRIGDSRKVVFMMKDIH